MGELKHGVDLNITKKDNHKCVGRVFKAEAKQYITKRGLGYTIRLNEIHSLSCPGCSNCGWQYENLDDLLLVGLKEVEDGKYYTLGICNISTDWETGISDWDVKLIPWLHTKEVLTAYENPTKSKEIG